MDIKDYKTALGNIGLDIFFEGFLKGLEQRFEVIEKKLKELEKPEPKKIKNTKR